MTELQPLFTAEQFFRAAHRLELPENIQQERAKPRASSILDCARAQVYTMNGETPSNPEEDTDHRDQAFSNEDNRRTEDLTVDVIAQMLGFAVVDRQISIGDTEPSTGHPDGAFEICGEKTDENGIHWGFEHKKLGRYSYLKVFKEGLMVAKPGYIVQAMVYGKALGWDAVQFVILAEDASSMRTEATRAKAGTWADRPDWNPKVQLPVVDLRPLYGMFPLIEARANALSQAVAEGLNGEDIEPEFNGTDRFPCGYCEFIDRCNLANQVNTVRETPLRVIPRTPLNAS